MPSHQNFSDNEFRRHSLTTRLASPGFSRSHTLLPGGREPHLTMPSRARRYIDLVLELKACRECGGDDNREQDLETEILDLWREMTVDERMAVEQALI